ncbi:MBL fold metallo-hydrolase [bacterium]|nr:MAG: MBL fold metallo-hydrolase [bacterium]
MKIKPHRWWRRFYNHRRESIWQHILSIARTALHFLKSKIWQFKKDMIPALVAWRHEGMPQGRSIEPIITWIGHATFLIQIGELNILTDPVFFEISAFSRRLMPPALTIEQLPRIDYILISHNHKDHLDKRSMQALRDHNATILVPLGNKRLLEQWGLTNVVEKNWWEMEVLSALNISFHCLPAAHWSARHAFNLNKALWASWMVTYKNFTLYFAGDTAYSSHFALIGRYFKMIDVVLMPIGPNEPRYIMKGSHVSTHEAVQAFLDLGARHFIPMHWGTFKSGSDLFEGPLLLLQELWQTRAEVLRCKTLHIVKFGEPCHF